MTPELWERVQQIVDELLDLSAAEREERIAAECGGDEELEREVRAILEVESKAAGLFQKVALPNEKTLSATLTEIPTFDHYRILDKIGVGGMGIVYRAMDNRLNREVALKFLSPQFCDDERARNRFLTEAKAISRIDHPNVCVILDVGEVGDNQLYFAMPHYKGKLLSDILSEGPVSVDRALELILQLCQGVSAAHRQGITHRDIKPANILVTDDGVAKLLDFGIARQPDSDLTQTGQALGTIAYMSPEQIKGEDVDARADIWSIGVILYELLTTHRPFRGGSYLEVSNAILSGLPTPISRFFFTVPEILDEIVSRTLCEDPAKRYPAVPELIEDLLQLKAELEEVQTPLERDQAAVARRAKSGSGGRSTRSGSTASRGTHAESVSETLDFIVDRYRQYVGPSARILVNTISPQCDNLEELCERLAAELADSDQQEAFFQEVAHLTQETTSRSHTARTGSRTLRRSQEHTAGDVPPPPPATEEPAGVPASRGSGRYRLLWGLGAGLVVAGLVAVLPVTRYFFQDQVERIVEPEAVARGVHSDRLVLGMTGAFTGAAREAGRSIQIGLTSAFKEVNANGGVHGRQIELNVMDDSYDPEVALTNITTLLAPETGVFALVGSFGTPTTLAVLPSILQDGTLLFGAFSGASALRNDPPDRFVFNYRASYWQEIKALLDHFVRQEDVDPARIGVFHEAGDLGKEGLTGVEMALTAFEVKDLALSVSYERNTSQVDEAVEAFLAARSRVSAVIIIGTYQASALFTKGLRDGGYEGFIGNVSFVGSRALAEEFKELGPEYGEGIVVSQVVPHYDSYATGVLAYREALKTYHPNEPPGFVSLEAYIVGKLFATALEAAGRHLTTDAIIEALQAIKELDLGTGPPMTFSPSQHQASDQVWGTRLSVDGTFEEIKWELPEQQAP